MASYKGAQVNDWVLVGALAITGYFVYVTVIKPIASVTQGASDLVGDVVNPTSKLLTGISNVTLPQIEQAFIPDQNSVGQKAIANTGKAISNAVSNTGKYLTTTAQNIQNDVSNPANSLPTVTSSLPTSTNNIYSAQNAVSTALTNIGNTIATGWKDFTGWL